MVRRRDGRNARGDRRRDSIEPIENANGLTLLYRGVEWK
jgi:hypothetical protein